MFCPHSDGIYHTSLYYIFFKYSCDMMYKYARGTECSKLFTLKKHVDLCNFILIQNGHGNSCAAKTVYCQLGNNGSIRNWQRLKRRNQAEIKINSLFYFGFLI